MRSASVGFHCPECTKSGAQQVYRARDLQTVPRFIYVLMGLSIVTFVAQGVSSSGSGFTSGDVVERGILFGPLVRQGEYWRLVTSGFLHADLFHIGLNMYALYLFGPAVERSVGALRMALIYLGGLLGGAAAVMLFNFGAPTLGASGAVLGLAGGLAAILWSRGIAITQTSLGTLFLLNLALPLLIPRISFWGHFGGIAGGFLVGWLVSFLPGKFRQPDGVANGLAAIVIVALAVVGVAAAEMSGVGL